MLVNKKNTKGGKRNYIKYFLWAPWIIAITFFFVRAGGVSHVDFSYFISNGVSLSEPYSYVIYYGVLLLVVVLALTMGKRAFCHSVCWMAPFMVIGTKVSDWLKLPKLHLRVNKDNCTGCKLCSAKCPMSLDVAEKVKRGKMKDAECILCGECVDVCTNRTIVYSFRK